MRVFKMIVIESLKGTPRIRTPSLSTSAPIRMCIYMYIKPTFQSKGWTLDKKVISNGRPCDSDVDIKPSNHLLGSQAKVGLATLYLIPEHQQYVKQLHLWLFLLV